MNLGYRRPCLKRKQRKKRGGKIEKGGREEGSSRKRGEEREARGEFGWRRTELFTYWHETKRSQGSHSVGTETAVSSKSRKVRKHTCRKQVLPGGPMNLGLAASQRKGFKEGD